MTTKLTKTLIDSLPYSDQNCFHFDSEVRGLCLRVGKKRKTFYVQGYVDGDKAREKIGHYGVVTLDEARKEAVRRLGLMASGVVPAAKLKQSDPNTVTLNDLWQHYQKARIADGGLRPKTIAVYESALRRCFGDWLDRPATEITKNAVVERFREIATNEGPRSKAGGAKAQAAQAMRVLRAILNFGSITYEGDDGATPFPANPVQQLSRLHRGWSKVAPRNEVIQPNELKTWYGNICALNNDTIRDYIVFCLFTGLRRSAAASIKWENVNLKARTVAISAEVDKTGKAFVLPLPAFIVDMLQRRSAVRRLDNPYVFPAALTTDHIKEPKKSIEKVVAKTGIKWSMHSLRRVFASTAERLDISYYKTKALLNHTLSKDVTASVYVQIDVDQLREPMELISKYLLEQMGVVDRPKTKPKTKKA
ncbi:MAG TPA: integrase family protein [Oculatellaceae cyanobacterium]